MYAIISIISKNQQMWN